MPKDTLDYEYVQVNVEGMTVERIVWRKYHTKAKGVFELTLDRNPHLAPLHAVSPFLPIGTVVRVPIVKEAQEGSAKEIQAIRLYGPANILGVR